MDIELTSRRPDEAWTWRAAGARQPRGVVAAALVPDGSKPGDILRAEVESGIEGIEILSVLPSRSPTREESENRIEVIGPRRTGPDVSVVLASGSKRRRESGAPERGGRPRRAGSGEGDARGGSGRPGGRPRGGESGDRGPERAGRSSRFSGAARSGEGRDRSRPARGPGGEPDDRGARRGPVRDRRSTVPMTHRNAALAEMRPEEVPVAEQLLRGGLPAVRQAIDAQNAAARQEGRPPIAAESLLATAERLLPAVNLATWKDRASAAQAAGRELRLRELRAVVTASRTVVLDQEARTMARALQESLEQRVNALLEEWLGRINKALDNGRVADALRTASRPPEPGTRCPAELAVRLADTAGATMTADLEVEEWLDLLDAVVGSPVRRNVRPAGVPPVEEARGAALRAAGSVPALARELGLPQPPPPPRRAVVRERPVTAPSGGPRSGGGSAGAS